MDAAVFVRLLDTEGGRLLEEVTAAYDGDNALSLAERLRSGYDADLVAAALTQVALRQKAAEKFGAAASRLFFTPDGLEQATHHVLATRRSHRAREAGVDRLLELGCGVGADLLALARTGIRVTAVERDILTAMVARANLEASGLSAEVEIGDARDRDRHGFDAVFTDPARRAGSRRIFDPAAFSPSWDFVADLLTGDAIVKAAPGIPHELLPSGVEAEWVSLDGQLREATIWSGRFAEVDRRASVLTSAGAAVEVTDSDEPVSVDVQPVGRYVYEPDDAVVRAHLVGAVAAAVDGWLLDPHLAYVSGDHRRAVPIAKGYEVLEVLPYQEKQLRSALRARDVGSLTIKKRGVGVPPEVLRRRLGLRGSRPATVVLSRTPSSAVALLVEPLPR